MSNKQNDIISDNIREAKEEPLGELVGIVETMLGRPLKRVEYQKFRHFLLKSQYRAVTNHITITNRAVGEIRLDKEIEIK